MDALKKGLQDEISYLNGQIRGMLKKQRERQDNLFGQAWLCIWEAQISSYERLLKTLEEDVEQTR